MRLSTRVLAAFLTLAMGQVVSLAFAQQKAAEYRINTGVRQGAVTQSNEKQDSPAREALKGKWIVRYVKRDGKPNPAQIGQKIGDIITIEKDGNALAFG